MRSAIPGLIALDHRANWSTGQHPHGWILGGTEGSARNNRFKMPYKVIFDTSPPLIPPVNYS
jgi:hypothetical protein